MYDCVIVMCAVTAVPNSSCLLMSSLKLNKLDSNMAIFIWIIFSMELSGHQKYMLNNNK